MVGLPGEAGTLVFVGDDGTIADRRSLPQAGRLGGGLHGVITVSAEDAVTVFDLPGEPYAGPDQDGIGRDVPNATVPLLP